jgi:hypothetical protein
LGEDGDCQITPTPQGLAWECSPGIFARLRSFAANILRFNNASNVANTRYRIAFGGIDAILGLRACIER